MNTKNYYKAYQPSLVLTCLSQMRKSKNKSSFPENTGLIRLHQVLFCLPLGEWILQIEALAIYYEPGDFIENWLTFSNMGIFDPLEIVFYLFKKFKIIN